MGNTVQGKNAVMQVSVSGIFYMVLCQVDFTFSYINENILKTDVNAGSYRKRRTRISDLAGSVNGVTTTTNNANSISVFYFLQEAIRRSVQQIRFLWKDDDGVIKTIDANLLIETIDITGPIGDSSKAEMKLVGAGGGLSIDPIIPPDEGTDSGIDSASWDTTPAATTISGLSVDGKSFVGKKVLLVSRTGAPHDLVTGTPGNLQAQVSEPAGTTIGFLNPFNDEETVFVVWEDA